MNKEEMNLSRSARRWTWTCFLFCSKFRRLPFSFGSAMVSAGAREPARLARLLRDRADVGKAS